MDGLNIVGIISNLDDEDAVTFVALYAKSIKNAAIARGEITGLREDLKFISDTDNRQKILACCSVLLKDLEGFEEKYL